MSWWFVARNVQISKSIEILDLKSFLRRVHFFYFRFCICVEILLIFGLVCLSLFTLNFIILLLNECGVEWHVNWVSSLLITLVMLYFGHHLGVVIVKPWKFQILLFFQHIGFGSRVFMNSSGELWVIRWMLCARNVHHALLRSRNLRNILVHLLDIYFKIGFFLKIFMNDSLLYSLLRN